MYGFGVAVVVLFEIMVSTSEISLELGILDYIEPCVEIVLCGIVFSTCESCRRIVMSKFDMVEGECTQPNVEPKTYTIYHNRTLEVLKNAQL